MNEPDILEAYRELGAPQSPPDDLLVRVDRTIRRRRTARRAVTGVAVLALAGGTGALLLGGSDGTNAKDLVATDPGSTSTLTFTHEAGETHTFAAADLELFCMTSDGGGERLILTRADLADDVRANREPSDEVLAAAPLLYVELHVDRITPGEEFRLPHDSQSGDSDERVMTFFVASEEGGRFANEVSSAEPGSEGVVTVHEAACGPTPTLSVEIDGRLGSEVEQAPLAIKGSYRS